MSYNNAQGLRADGSSFKILIVDDSTFITKRLVQILQSQKYEIVEIAQHGEDALEKYKSLHFNIDLITMDITMPKMDGVQCLKKILEFNDKAKVIMVSAIGKEDIVKKCLLLGAKSYILKPLDQQKVLERVHNVLC